MQIGKAWVWNSLLFCYLTRLYWARICTFLNIISSAKFNMHTLHYLGRWKITLIRYDMVRLRRLSLFIIFCSAFVYRCLSAERADVKSCSYNKVDLNGGNYFDSLHLWDTVCHFNEAQYTFRSHIHLDNGFTLAAQSAWASIVIVIGSDKKRL